MTLKPQKREGRFQERELNIFLLRLHFSMEADDREVESSLSKMKASFSLIGMEYQDEHRPKFFGTVEYKKKNIRFQNRQLKMHVNKQPKHIYFDDDGNAITPTDVV